jgi:hypothetical protein
VRGSADRRLMVRAKSSGSPPQRIICDERNALMMEVSDELCLPGARPRAELPTRNQISANFQLIFIKA